MIDVRDGTSGWESTPWWNSETNFDPNTFTCGATALEDCGGQVVRWYILHFAAGGSHLGWYYFNTTIGQNYDTAYYNMMQWLVGATLPTGCDIAGTVYSCPLTRAAGYAGLAVWDTSGPSSYAVPAGGYTQYRDPNGSVGVSARIGRRS